MRENSVCQLHTIWHAWRHEQAAARCASDGSTAQLLSMAHSYSMARVRFTTLQVWQRTCMPITETPHRFRAQEAMSSAQHEGPIAGHHSLELHAVFVRSTGKPVVAAVSTGGMQRSLHASESRGEVIVTTLCDGAMQPEQSGSAGVASTLPPFSHFRWTCW